LLPQDEGHAIGGHTTVTPDLVIIMERFEALKLAFTGKEDNTYQDVISLPRSIVDIPDNLENGIQDSNIKITK
jgi:hypothetical protein